MRFTSSVLAKFALAALIMMVMTASAWAQRQILPPGEEPTPDPPMSPAALLGQAIFFDTALSRPSGQSCASCHAGDVGWVDPRSVGDPIYTPTSEGAVPGRYGKRNGLTVTYADLGPPFHFDTLTNSYVGGRYWDGRAKNALDQATVPFLDRLEMNNPSIQALINKIRQAPYASQFETVCGTGIFDNETAALDCVARSLVAFQESRTLNRFTSRYDRFLKGDTTALTPAEKGGLALFEGKGGCAACHPSQKHPDGSMPTFTTFRYENLGVPKNPNNPFYTGPVPTALTGGRHYVDLGLGGPDGGAPNVASEMGKFKIPTLRNVALTPPYSHNGLFTTLYDVVQFHNTRDIDPSWGPPEVAQNLSTGACQVRAAVSIEGPIIVPPGEPPPTPTRLGNLGLSAGEVDQIVAFLKTLSDSFVAP